MWFIEPLALQRWIWMKILKAHPFDGYRFHYQRWFSWLIPICNPIMFIWREKDTERYDAYPIFIGLHFTRISIEVSIQYSICTLSICFDISKDTFVRFISSMSLAWSTLIIYSSGELVLFVLFFLGVLFHFILVRWRWLISSSNAAEDT